MLIFLCLIFFFFGYCYVWFCLVAKQFIFLLPYIAVEEEAHEEAEEEASKDEAEIKVGWTWFAAACSPLWDYQQ